MSSSDEGLIERSRVTVFAMFGTVFGYATHEQRASAAAHQGP
ncbi:hypothetical protein [Streptomyces sp. NPDC001594]